MSDAIFNAAIELADSDISVFPVNPANKRPLVESWLPYQGRVASYDEIEAWWSRWPNANVAIVTGRISRIVVVDTDNPEAEAWWRAYGQSTPAVVKTRKGRHFYYRWPGYEVRNAANWNGVKGLDVRGDGGYVVAPPSQSQLEDGTTVGYEWESRYDLDELPEFNPHVWAKIDEDAKLPSLIGVDLEGATAASKLEGQPKLKDGQGRNVTMTEFVGERVQAGRTDDEIWDDMAAFQERYFEDHLEDDELRTILHSIRKKDRDNHPERYDLNTGELAAVTCPDGIARPKNIPGLISATEFMSIPLPPRRYLIEPWLEQPGIVQVYGYSGDGKTLFTLGGCYCLAAGRDFGPYRITEPRRVLYVDYDMSSHDMQSRLRDMRAMFGDVGDRFQVLSLSLMGDNVYRMDIRQREGLNSLLYAIARAKADVVVLDNMRTLCPGMKENDANEWSAINNGLIALRNQTGLAIVYVHHSNKPQRDGKGKVYAGAEAGSSNQLTPLEVQINVSRLNEPAIRDEEDEWTRLYDRMNNENRGDGGAYVRHALVVEYGKVRNREPGLHTTGFLAFGRSLKNRPAFTSSLSNRTRAAILYNNGRPVPEICHTLRIDRETVERWLRETMRS